MHRWTSHATGPRRKIIFLVGLVIPMVFYTASIMNTQKLTAQRYTIGSALRAVDNERTRQKVVVLYSNQRSGSSFTGEIFNRNPRAFYLYEPLFPFTPHCKWMERERTEVLERMLNCDFANNTDVFTSVQQVTQYKDTAASSCIRNGICFASNSEALRKRYPEYCKIAFPRSDCVFPPQQDLVSKMCSIADVVAYKVLRVCSLNDIDELYQKMSREGRDVYVIHLVRDPRAIISSKLHLELNAKDTLERTRELCEKMERNLKFIHSDTDIPAIVQRGRYFRVRYEDAATDPLKTAGDIYRFIGQKLPKEVASWLNTSTLAPGLRKQKLMDQMKAPGTNKKRIADQYLKLQKQLKNPYGTVKEPSTTVQKWRSYLKIEVVQKIQKICVDVLDRLKYQQVSSDKALLDLETRLW